MCRCSRHDFLGFEFDGGHQKVFTSGMSACISEPRSFYNDTHQAAWKHRQRALRGKILPSTMPKPSIRILIGALNVERFIAEALRSVPAQDYHADRREILVVDDGSTDGTRKMLERFEPAMRISPKPTAGRRGLSMLELRSSGAIVAFLDGDDWRAPNKLSCVAQAFETHSSVGFVANSITEVLADGSPRSELVRDAPLFRIDSVAGARNLRLRTGVRVVMNTTFNLRDEAIVHTPTDAIGTFFGSGMDARVVGSFLVEK